MNIYAINSAPTRREVHSSAAHLLSLLYRKGRYHHLYFKEFNDRNSEAFGLTYDIGIYIHQNIKQDIINIDREVL